MVCTENCHQKVKDCNKTLGYKDLFFVQCFINGCLNLNDGSEEIKNLIFRFFASKLARFIIRISRTARKVIIEIEKL